jgi:hypothetical protein
VSIPDIGRFGRCLNPANPSPSSPSSLNCCLVWSNCTHFALPGAQALSSSTELIHFSTRCVASIVLYLFNAGALRCYTLCLLCYRWYSTPTGLGAISLHILAVSQPLLFRLPKKIPSLHSSAPCSPGARGRKRRKQGVREDACYRLGERCYVSFCYMSSCLQCCEVRIDVRCENAIFEGTC